MDIPLCYGLILDRTPVTRHMPRACAKLRPPASAGGHSRPGRVRHHRMTDSALRGTLPASRSPLAPLRATLPEPPLDTPASDCSPPM